MGYLSVQQACAADASVLAAKVSFLVMGCLSVHLACAAGARVRTAMFSSLSQIALGCSKHGQQMPVSVLPCSQFVLGLPVTLQTFK